VLGVSWQAQALLGSSTTSSFLAYPTGIRTGTIPILAIHYVSYLLIPDLFIIFHLLLQLIASLVPFFFGETLVPCEDTSFS